MIKHLTMPEDASAAQWIAVGSKDLAIGQVASLVPGRFESYVRILHPARTADGKPVRWSEIAATEGRKIDASTNWYQTPEIQSSGNIFGLDWEGGAPDSSLWDNGLSAVCRLLGEDLSPGEEVYFGLWNGWGPKEYSELWRQIEKRPGNTLPPLFSDIPFAGRDYFLLKGPLSAAEEMVDNELVMESPHYIWPANRQWLLVNDMDLDSTYVGGSKSLVESF